MRVLVCSQGFPRHPDDHHATFILDHARALARAGHQVAVLCPSAPGLPAEERFGDIDVVRFRYAPRRLEVLAYTGAMHRKARGWPVLLLPLFFAGFLVAALRRGRDADVLHAHWWVPSGLVVVIAGRLAGVASVVHLHGTDAALARGPVRILARWVLRHAGAVVAVSRDLAEWAKRIASVDAIVEPMPLATERVPDPTPAPTDGPVLAVGRLVKEKGFDILVEAAARSKVDVVVVGDGPERARLTALAREQHAQVDFVGAVPAPVLAEWYRRCRAVAVPSRREGYGLVAAEAVAAGRTVVASAVGGLVDVVTPGVNGVLIPPDDVEALTRALVELDPALVDPRRPTPGDLLVVGAAPASKPLAPALVRAAGAVFAVVAVALLARAIARQWDDVRRLELTLSVAPLVAGVACTLVANLVLASSWGWLVRRLGGDLPWQTAMRVFWTGQLGKYLPTGLGAAPARVVLAARNGVKRRPVVTATAAEPLALVAASAALAAIRAPVALLLCAVALAAIVPRPFALFGAVQLAQVSLRAVGFFAILHLVGPAKDPELIATMSAVGLSYLLGLLAVFAPGGIGVREAALAGTLGPMIGVPAAAAAGVLWRMIELAVEAALSAWSRTLPATQRAQGEVLPTGSGRIS